MSEVQPMYKKGKRDDCGNYHGIALLNAACKIYSKVETFRVQKIAEVRLLEEQSGFCKGHSCVGSVFTLSTEIHIASLS